MRNTQFAILYSDGGHDLWKDSDFSPPNSICNQQGEVVLAMCKRCGQAEIDLEPTCPGKPPEKILYTPVLEADRLIEIMKNEV